MRSCQELFNYLSGSPPFSSIPPPPLPFSRPPPDLHRKRPFHPTESSTAGGRMIAPKPSTFQQDPAAGSAYTMPAMNEPPVKKKRGRPTKAELEARQISALAAAASQSPAYSTTTTTTTTGPPVQQPPALSSPLTPSVETPVSLPSSTGNVAPGARLTTPIPPSSDIASETSSKRKRGRPSKAELDHRKAHDEAAQEPSSTVTSPPPPTEPRPPSASATPVPASENRADDIQDRMRVEKFMREQP